MAKITNMRVGESLVGDGNEIAHIDLIMGPRGSAAETAFANALTNNKDGFSTLLAVVAPKIAIFAVTHFQIIIVKQGDHSGPAHTTGDVSDRP